MAKGNIEIERNREHFVMFKTTCSSSDNVVKVIFDFFVSN